MSVRVAPCFVIGLCGVRVTTAASASPDCLQNRGLPRSWGAVTGPTYSPSSPSLTASAFPSLTCLLPVWIPFPWNAAKADAWFNVSWAMDVFQKVHAMGLPWCVVLG